MGIAQLDRHFNTTVISDLQGYRAGALISAVASEWLAAGGQRRLQQDGYRCLATA